jgi:hypothetical protein
MKTAIFKSALALACLAAASCAGTAAKKKEAEEAQQPGYSRYLQDNSQQPAAGNTAAGNTSTDAGTSAPASDNPPVPPAPNTPPNTAANPAPTTPAAPTTPPPPATPQTPYGRPVVGKKGFVYSPFSDSNQMIDVRDFPSGSKVRDPYTNKIFLVP